MNRNAKKLLINLLVAFAALLICFLLTEIVLRLTIYNFKDYPASRGPGSVYSINTPEFRTRVSINRVGLRGKEIEGKKEGEYRILCVGDSFTFGLGVDLEQSYPVVLETLLQKKDPRFTVINGAHGRSAEQNDEFLVSTTLALKPDFVIYQFYIGNDFYDGALLPPANTGPAPPAARPNFFWEKLAQFKNMLKQNCRTLDFLWGRLTQFRFVDDLLFNTNLRYNNSGIFLKKYPTLEKQHVQHELEELKKIHDLLESRHVKELFLIIPSKDQVYKKHLFVNEKYDYKKPNAILKKFCRDLGIPFIDLLDAYEPLPRKELLTFYYGRDEHWTARGYHHAASVVADWFDLKGKDL